MIRIIPGKTIMIKSLLIGSWFYIRSTDHVVYCKIHEDLVLEQKFENGGGMDTLIKPLADTALMYSDEVTHIKLVNMEFKEI